MPKYNFLVVGTGIFGSIFAHEMKKKNKKVLIIDKRPHIGGNAYTENVDKINVHKYGAHIFHTSNKRVWDYINKFANFNSYVNRVIANYKGEIYNLPFNMNTFSKMWNIRTPEEAKEMIQKQIKKENIKDPKNLEEQAISMVGRDIYEKLIKGYTAKQWGRNCEDLPSFIIKRLPVRFTYDNNYFNDTYQGIPIGGYTKIIEKLLDGIEVRLNTDFLDNREKFEDIADKIIYTGEIDKFYLYRYGNLEYRSLKFESQKLDTNNFQGNAVVNYTDSETKFTRIIEHKFFETRNPDDIKGTIITKEYPAKWDKNKEPYYPVNDEKNMKLYEKYEELAKKETKVIFGGRLGTYRYLDMHITIEKALELAEKF